MRITLGREIRGRVVAKHDFGQRTGTPKSAPDGGWLIHQVQAGEVQVLDAELKVRRTLTLSGELTAWQAVALSPDSQWLAASGVDRVLIMNIQGNTRHELRHQPWPTYARGDCTFDVLGRLWCALGVERLGLVEVSSGQVLAECTVPNNEGAFFLRPGHDADCMVVDIACGQDGAFTYVVVFSGGQLAVQPLLQDGQGSIFADLSPDEQQSVFLDQNGEGCGIYSFPEGKLQRRIEAAPLFEESEFEMDVLQYQAQYVLDGPLVVTTRSNRLLCFDPHSLELLGTLWPDGYELQWFDQGGQPTTDPEQYVDCEGDLTSVHRAGNRELLIVRRECVAQLVELEDAL